MKMEISFAKVKDAKELAKIDKIANKELKWWHPSNKNHFEKIMEKSKNFGGVALPLKE